MRDVRGWPGDSQILAPGRPSNALFNKGGRMGRDTGDGRQLIASPFFGQSAFYTAQTYPLRFLSPMGRFSLRINQKLRWNVGYQYYGYNADFYNNLDYHAHTGYTSLLWSF